MPEHSYCIHYIPNYVMKNGAVRRIYNGTIPDGGEEVTATSVVRPM